MFNFEPYYERTACICASGRCVSFRELDCLAKRIGECLPPRRLVFCLCSNTVGSVAGYVAFLRNGDVSLLLDPRMDEEAFVELVETYRPGYVWAPADWTKSGRCGRGSNGVSVAGSRIIFESEGYVLQETCIKTSAGTGTEKSMGTNAEPVQLAENLALLLTTSGSTGSPKLVRLTEENLRSNARAIIECLGITGSERPVMSLPMFYVFGLSIINSHLMAGATLLLTEASFAESNFWKFAVGNGFTSFSGVPYTFEMVKKLGIWRQEMPTLRTLAQAGGSLCEELIRFYDEEFTPRGVRFFVMYGQTEAAARMSCLNPELLRSKAGSIGRGIPGGHLSLIDDDGREIVEAGVTGELVYSGPNVCLGYAECADDLARGDDNHGVLRTGDLARKDSDGYFYITGRKGRFVKLYGSRVSLDHLERLLHPVLSDCVCVGDDTGVTVYTADAECDKEAVIGLLSSRTRIVKKAFSVRHIAEIPRSGAGKVLYGELESYEVQDY